MTSPRSRPLLPALLGALLVATKAAPCTRLCKDPPVYLPPKQAEIPGNLIRFRVLVPEPGRLELRAKGRKKLPASTRAMGRDRVFAPDAPVAAGTELTLSYELECGRERSEGEYTFRVGPPATVELRKAELTLYEVGTRDPGSAWNEAAFVRVRYGSPESSGNAGHLIQSTVTIDGRPYHFDGRESDAGGSIIEITSDCMLRGAREDADYQVDSCGALRNVPPGAHTVEVKPHLVGGDRELAPVRLEVTTVCPHGLRPVPAASHRIPDVPAPPGSALPTAGAQPGASTSARTPPKQSSSGCALGAAAPGTPSVVFLAALAALARRRRERAQLVDDARY